ncbi:MAG TPA: UDP-N-acetylmuramoyl-L-alanine--D-glutamate ligase [Burkholderiales bacterium]|nr:UDP-N-acetylmuramoyl-L-alanine--D-glutamate ligase [Burkholderiales bacterium]
MRGNLESINLFANQTVVVAGLGDTGMSCVRFLAAQGAKVFVQDSRVSPPHAGELCKQFPGIPLKTGSFDVKEFLESDALVVSPGISLAEPAIAAAMKAGIPVFGDIEIFARILHLMPVRPIVIAITGANGKSTVTELAGAMCRGSGLKTIVAGNIGLPVLDAVGDGSVASAEAIVLELSSFQLETTFSLDADAATVLNLTQDHMDRYRGMENYAAAKSRIFNGHGVQVLNRDDTYSTAMALVGRKILTFGLDEPHSKEDYGLRSLEKKRYLVCGEEPVLPLTSLPLLGLHNAANIMAALALCESVGLDREPLLSALSSFKGLPHRMMEVDRINGIAFIDDSKGTNVGATIAALNGMSSPAVLIAGGDGKGQDFTPLKDAIESHARAVVLMGQDAPAIEHALSGITIPISYASQMEEAVQRAFSLARHGDTVLLSPACASFDMFRNYVHRAEVFKAAIRKLEKRGCHD